MVTMPNMARNRRKTEEQQIKFVGIDYRTQHGDGSMMDSEHISTECYPSIVPSGEFEKVGEYSGISCMKGFGDDLLVCAGQYIYWNGDEVGMLSYEDKDGGIDVNTARTAAMINTHIFILPDKLILDTASGEVTETEQSYDFGGFILYRKYIESEMQYFHILDLSDDGDDPTDMLMQMKVGDTVFLDGFEGVSETWAANNKPNGITVRYLDVESCHIGFYDNSFPIVDENEKAAAHMELLRMEYRCPDLRLVAEHNNRLWGIDGNTVYACALGDARNWYRYDGLADDAYTLAVAGGGEFTAVCSYSTHVCLFKEDRIIRIYGNKPSNFNTANITAPGVCKGGQNTVQVIDGVLYYAGANGIYAYSGDTPDCVSEQLGNGMIDADFAAVQGTQYFVYMDCGREKRMYCMDASNGLWTVLDHEWYAAGTTSENRLYLATPTGDILRNTDRKKNVEWSVTLNEVTEGVAARKSYGKIVVQCDMEKGASMSAEVRFDGGRWIRLRSMQGRYGSRVLYFPVPPNRCYAMQLRLSGKGNVAINGIARSYSLLSDVR